MGFWLVGLWHTKQRDGLLASFSLVPSLTFKTWSVKHTRIFALAEWSDGSNISSKLTFTAEGILEKSKWKAEAVVPSTILSILKRLFCSPDVILMFLRNFCLIDNLEGFVHGFSFLPFTVVLCLCYLCYRFETSKKVVPQFAVRTWDLFVFVYRKRKS